MLFVILPEGSVPGKLEVFTPNELDVVNNTSNTFILCLNINIRFVLNKTLKKKRTGILIWSRCLISECSNHEIDFF